MEFNIHSVTRQYLLSVLSQEEIAEYYLGVTVTYGRLISSPLRVDRDPSFGFMWKNGKLIMRDFNGLFHGDVFDLVQYITGSNHSDALKRIHRDLIEKRKTPLNRTRIEEEKKKINDIPSIIQIKSQEFTRYDLKYWQSFGITEETLKKYFVKSCKAVFVDGVQVYSYKVIDPAYDYNFGKGRHKVYFPQRDNYRFLCNTNAFQGVYQLPDKASWLIITKSLKDVMVLHELGIAAVAPQAETNHIPENVIEYFRTRFDRIIIFFDNDEAGLRAAQREALKHSLEYITIPEEFNAKDISDFSKLHGLSFADTLLNSII